MESSIYHVSAVLILVAALQSIGAYWALAWALPKSNVTFFSVFVGDALLRLAVLGMATLWLTANHQPYTLPLLSLALSYLVLTVIQIPFFNRAR